MAACIYISGKRNYICIYVAVSIYIYTLYTHIYGKWKQQTSICLQQRKWKTEVCFPWSANDNRWSTIAVSANVPIYYCSRQQFIPMNMKLFLMVGEREGGEAVELWILCHHFPHCKKTMPNQIWNRPQPPNVKLCNNLVFVDFVYHTEEYWYVT